MGGEYPCFEQLLIVNRNVRSFYLFNMMLKYSQLLTSKGRIGLFMNSVNEEPIQPNFLFMMMAEAQSYAQLIWCYLKFRFAPDSMQSSDFDYWHEEMEDMYYFFQNQNQNQIQVQEDNTTAQQLNLLTWMSNNDVSIHQIQGEFGSNSAAGVVKGSSRVLTL